MRRALRVHPDFSRGPVTRIEVDFQRTPAGRLAISYELTGRTEALRIPAASPPGRADGLWRRTCFEAFLAVGDGAGYLEFNLSPSSQWAAYRFSGYREGMQPLDGLLTPRIEFASTAEGLVLKAALDLAALSDIAGADAWRLGLSAVIEDEFGRIAYWALAHPPGKPDFHHADGFACLVRAPEAP